MNKLQEFELRELGQLQAQEKQMFIIKDIEGLNWALRKIRILQAELNKIELLAQKERQRIDAWAEKESAELREDVTLWEQKVMRYHAQILEANPEQKSISTPYGKVKSVTRQAQAEKVDDAALINYALDNDSSFVEVAFTRKLLWGELKKTLEVVQRGGEHVVIDSDGQIVPGVIVKPAMTTFKVEVVDDEEI